MKRVISIFVLILIGVSAVQANENYLPQSGVIAPRIDIKYLGWNHGEQGSNMLVSLKYQPSGKYVYFENYYSFDFNGKPKLENGIRHEGFSNGKDTFSIVRPKDGHGRRYTLVEKGTYINGQRITQWVDLRNYWN